MPQITIEISEQQEAVINEAIRSQENFVIDGGRVETGNSRAVLRSIEFKFRAAHVLCKFHNNPGYMGHDGKPRCVVCDFEE
jgi:hypothetical protein